MSLQIMLTVSVLALQWKSSVLLFLFEVSLLTDSGAKNDWATTFFVFVTK